jgi:hypothetical protein
MQRVPPDAVRLELRHESISGVQVIASWQRAELEHASTSADLILAVAQDHCEDQERRTRCECVWIGEKPERVLATKGVRCEPSEKYDEPTPVGSGSAPKEDPTIGGLTAQLMRHVENRERLLNIALSTNLKTLTDQLRDARTEADSLRGELRQERQRSREREQLAEDEDSNSESIARAEAMAKVADAVVTHLVPLAAARLREGMM